MVKRFWTIISLLVILLSIAIFEEVYTNNVTNDLKTKTNELYENIQSENLTLSSQNAEDLKNYWHNKEIIISMFVDYRDIEQIGKQISLIVSHLSNTDFELAKVECNLLLHMIETFDITISFDFQNII